MTSAPASSADSLTPHSLGSWGLDFTDRDPLVRPGDDFYLSQNGSWLARTTLGPTRPFAAYWFDLRQLAPRRVAALLRDVAGQTAASPDSPDGQAGALYRAFMDEHTIEAKGLAPLDAELAAVRAVTTRRQLAKLMGRMAGPGTPRVLDLRLGASIGRNGAFAVDIREDQANPNRYAVYIGQSGLNLPGPEYYSDPQLAEFKAAYEVYVAKMLRLLAWPQAEARAKDIVALETRIAAVSWSHEQMRDVKSLYNPMTVSALNELAPDFDWRAFLAGAELDTVRHVIVDAKGALPGIARVFAQTPINVWQARQAFAIIDDAAKSSYLNAAANDAAFDFRFRRFNNPSAIAPPRSVRVANVITRNLGGLVSALYLARYYPPEVRAAGEQMAEHIRRAFDTRLQTIEWMSPGTRAAARAKLARMTISIGAPGTLPTYRGLVVRDSDLYGDTQRATAYDWHRLVNRLGAPFDRSEWNAPTTPQFPNYNYDLTSNAVQIPAAMFEPPFFDVHADAAINYGAIGIVIAQMLVSGFDNAGRHYDADGRLHDWWTPAEDSAFAAKTKALSEQYSAIEPLPGLHVKGDLVVNEAIDDLGGFLLALDAYHLSLEGRPAPVLNGFTGDQRFFLGRAQMWRAKFDPAFVRNQLATGVNAQPFLRVNGPIRHVSAWYDAFGVQPGDAMYIAPAQRVTIW